MVEAVEAWKNENMSLLYCKSLFKYQQVVHVQDSLLGSTVGMRGCNHPKDFPINCRGRDLFHRCIRSKWGPRRRWRNIHLQTCISSWVCMMY